MYKLYKGKRASLNLSINAIVIVVLAMTLLGLGLGFIRGMFEDISGTTTEVQEQVREQITAQLRTSGEKISFPRALQFNRAEAKVITLGVQNTEIKPLFFKVTASWDTDNSDNGTENFDLRWDQTCLRLSPADAEVYGINVVAPRTPGTFALRADIKQYEEESCTTELQTYATKLTFITVG